MRRISARREGGEEDNKDRALIEIRERVGGVNDDVDACGGALPSFHTSDAVIDWP